jgi:hypothetical protein
MGASRVFPTLFPIAGIYSGLLSGDFPDRFFESRLQTVFRSFYGGNSGARRVFSRF